MFKVKSTHKVSFNEMKRLGDIINGPEAQAEEVLYTKTEKLKGRKGYDPDFLEDWTIDLPKATGIKAYDMLKLKDTDDVELKYTHFSIIMSRSRKLSMITAVNIDGNQSKKIGRSDKWYLDSRIEKNQQFGNELYQNNRFDRGHMVRREDPVWGDDAATANLDTFHYTNACPQIDVFNQHTWLGLENYILQNARVYQMKVSVFTGPFFTNNDITYKNARIPGAYWKVIAFLKEDGTPSATAYKISQENELSDIGFIYGPYKTYQISIREVMMDTNIDFEALEQYDGFSQHEIMASLSNFRKEIRNFNDIML
jgi:endonuclease G